MNLNHKDVPEQGEYENWEGFFLLFLLKRYINRQEENSHFFILFLKGLIFPPLTSDTFFRCGGRFFSHNSVFLLPDYKRHWYPLSAIPIKVMGIAKSQYLPCKVPVSPWNLPCPLVGGSFFSPSALQRVHYSLCLICSKQAGKIHQFQRVSVQCVCFWHLAPHYQALF